MVCWMTDKPLQPKGRYALKHTTRWTRAIVTDFLYRLDVNTGHRDEGARAARPQRPRPDPAAHDDAGDLRPVQAATARPARSSSSTRRRTRRSPPACCWRSAWAHLAASNSEPTPRSRATLTGEMAGSNGQQQRHPASGGSRCMACAGDRRRAARRSRRPRRAQDDVPEGYARAMSPSTLHEDAKKIIARLIETWARERDVDLRHRWRERSGERRRSEGSSPTKRSHVGRLDEEGVPASRLRSS